MRVCLIRVNVWNKLTHKDKNEALVRNGQCLKWTHKDRNVTHYFDMDFGLHGSMSEIN